MYHDNPSTHVFEKIKEMLYEGPFNISIAGTAETVGKLSREKVISLFKSFYSTNNMIFSAVGKTDWEKVLSEAKKFPKTSKDIIPIPIRLKNGELIEKRKGIDQAHLVFGFHCPKLVDRDRYAAEVLDNVLGGGMSSRLFQEIREKRGLCYAIKSNLEQSKDYGYEMIYSGTTKDKVKKIKELIILELKKLESLSKRELEETKEQLIGARQISKEKCETTMMELIQEEMAGNAENYYNYEENIGRVKLEDVRRLSKLKGYSFVALVPE